MEKERERGREEGEEREGWEGREREKERGEWKEEGRESRERHISNYKSNIYCVYERLCVVFTGSSATWMTTLTTLST